jgi:hypothetical protein
MLKESLGFDYSKLPAFGNLFRSVFDERCSLEHGVYATPSV